MRLWEGEMNVLDAIKNEVLKLYITHPDIHVNVTLKRPHRQTFYNLPVVIRDVYPHMFQVEYQDGGTARLYMHQYSDIITKDIEILELPVIKTQSDKK